MVDRIIVIEAGNHEELMKNEGKYSHMYKSEDRWYSR